LVVLAALEIRPTEKQKETMKSKRLLSSLLLLTTVAILSLAALTAADKKLTPKISKAEAKKIALAKVPGGKIKEAELEEEKGKLIWSFDIATKGTKNITEVQVDAITGAIVSVATETLADQKKEKQEDSQEKKEQKAK